VLALVLSKPLLRDTISAKLFNSLSVVAFVLLSPELPTDAKDELL